MGFEIADQAPRGEHVTDYDREHAPLYLRMLDAEAAGAAWEDVAGRLLQVDPLKDRDRARLRFETHLARARWLRAGGLGGLGAAPLH
jgi:hypothetical protein